MKNENLICNIPIGVFDSGVGGLTVLGQLSQYFPAEAFIYYGDSGRAPYGGRSKSELKQFAEEIIDFLLQQKIKLLIVACNTSCALVLDDIRSQYQIPIIGLISPAAKEAVSKTKTKRIAILATEQTVRSSAYHQAILDLDPQIHVLQIPCPELVPIVENGDILSATARSVALTYFQQVIEFKADTIVYGCSHYPYFESIFKSVSSSVSEYIDPGKSILSDVLAILQAQNLVADQINPLLKFWVSGDIVKFKRFLGQYFPWDNPLVFPHHF